MLYPPARLPSVADSGLNPSPSTSSAAASAYVCVERLMLCGVSVAFLRKGDHGYPGVKPTIDSGVLNVLDEDLSQHRKMGKGVSYCDIRTVSSAWY